MNVVTDGYEINSTPEPRPDGRFSALAVVTRLADGEVQEIRPEFDPFVTQSEASSAAQLAALAWVSHQRDTPPE